jgi:hypothetical protein
MPKAIPGRTMQLSSSRTNVRAYVNCVVRGKASLPRADATEGFIMCALQLIFFDDIFLNYDDIFTS